MNKTLYLTSVLETKGARNKRRKPRALVQVNQTQVPGHKKLSRWWVEQRPT